MIDIKLILEKPEYVKAALAKKLWDFDPEPIIALSKKRIELLQKVEANKAKQNKLSASVPAAKKAGEDVTKIFAEVKALAASNKADEEELSRIEGEIRALIEVLPNMPDDDLLSGGKENNTPIYHFGEERKFDFTPATTLPFARCAASSTISARPRSPAPAPGFIPTLALVLNGRC